VAACMQFSNDCARYLRRAAGGPHRPTLDEALDRLLLVLAPMAPHLAAEAWERRHGPGSDIHRQPWPTADPELVRQETATLVVQVNGKLRDRLEVPADADEEQVVALALASPRVAQVLGGRAPQRIVARPPRLVNLVLG
jgi:leucyl-tRNA synthetase